MEGRLGLGWPGRFHTAGDGPGKRKERGSWPWAWHLQRSRSTRSWALGATTTGCLWLGQRVPGKKLAGDENEKTEFGPNLAFSARKRRS